MGTLVEFILVQSEQFRRARLPSLYSDFTLQRSSNPDGFAANVAAWQDVLGKAAQAGVIPADGAASDTLSITTGGALLQALETREWGRPLALGSVIDESVRHRQMMPYQDFMTASKSIHNTRWTVEPWWLLSWGLKQLGVLNPSSLAETLASGRFVIMPNIERAAGRVMGEMTTMTNVVDRILPMQTFREEASNALGLNRPLSDSDLAVLLKTLSRDKGFIVCDERVVKFKALGETSTTLSMTDLTIASLKLLMNDLNTQVTDLARKITELSTAARDAVGEKDRSLALATLKSKKLKEGALVQRTDMLSQLETVFRQIEQAHDQVAVTQIMQDSTSVLRNLRVQTGGVEKVEEIVEGLRDEIQQSEEIGSILETSGQSNVVDASAVDDELEQMLQLAKAREQEEEARRTQRKLDDIQMPRAAIPQAAQITDGLADNDVDAMKRLSLDAGSSSISPAQIELAPGG